MDEHAQGPMLKPPALLRDARSLAADAREHGEVRLVEVAKAADTAVEGDRDEVERAERGEVPLHVGEEHVACGGGWVAEEDLVGLGCAGQDVLNPVRAGEYRSSERRLLTHHWVRDGGNAEMYGLTILSYSAGVSWTMENSCWEYCRVGGQHYF